MADKILPYKINLCRRIPIINNEHTTHLSKNVNITNKVWGGLLKRVCHMKSSRSIIKDVYTKCIINDDLYYTQYEAYTRK